MDPQIAPSPSTFPWVGFIAFCCSFMFLKVTFSYEYTAIFCLRFRVPGVRLHPLRSPLCPLGSHCVPWGPTVFSGVPLCSPEVPLCSLGSHRVPWGPTVSLQSSFEPWNLTLLPVVPLWTLESHCVPCSPTVSLGVPLCLSGSLCVLWGPSLPPWSSTVSPGVPLYPLEPHSFPWSPTVSSTVHCVFWCIPVFLDTHCTQGVPLCPLQWAPKE
jgi:hypothetical protein